MRTKLATLGAAVAALALAAQAHAAVVSFAFNGSGVSGQGLFQIVPNVAPPDPDALCGTTGHNACRTDPPGAWAITGASGTFTDTAAGLNNVAITGVVPIAPANERDPVFDPLVPSSLSFIDFAPGPNGFLSYNDLYFPNGSPVDCAFPFSGTYVDVFGVAMTLAGGDTLNLWGDGDELGPGTTTYGVGVTDGAHLLDYRFDGVNGVSPVPEPGTWMLLLAGFGLVALTLRGRRRGPALA